MPLGGYRQEAMACWAASTVLIMGKITPSGAISRMGFTVAGLRSTTRTMEKISAAAAAWMWLRIISSVKPVCS